MSNRFFTKYFMSLQLVVLVSICVCCNPPKQSTSQNSPQQNVSAQHRHNPYPIIQQKYFTRVWVGTRWCNGDTTGTGFQVSITAKDSVTLYVTGFDNSKASVVANARGYLVLIENQNLKLPSGDCIVNGTLALSNDHDILRGYYTLQTNGVTDSCKVAFRAAK